MPMKETEHEENEGKRRLCAGHPAHRGRLFSL
jgi:hypothetical protein